MTVDINPQTIKKLREKTGAGMMNCKNALKETNGDFQKAIEFLRKKGLASADKKLTREAKEGLIESYIHTGSKLAVLVEVNCETDFVSRREEFQELTKNIAMQIAASPSVIYVSFDDIPKEFIEKEIDAETLISAGSHENKVLDNIFEKLQKNYPNIKDFRLKLKFKNNIALAIFDFLDFTKFSELILDLDLTCKCDIKISFETNIFSLLLLKYILCFII